jgi:hypothetical protein
MTGVTDDPVVRQAGRRPGNAWWQALRVALVLGWVAWAGVTWWSAPRESTAAQARADSAAGRLSYHEWGDGWLNSGGLVSSFPVRLESGGGPMLLWHTTDGRRHYTTVDEAPIANDPLTVDDTSAPSPEADALTRELQAQEARRPADPPLGAIQAGLPIAGSVLVLWALVSAADPVTGTKWFWFWLVAGVPLGLGLLWWLARERPWSSRATPRPGPPDRDNRLKWWAGIGIGILARLGISLLLLLLSIPLGEALIPGPH